MPPSIQQPAPIKVMHIASGDRWAGAEAQLWTLVRHLNKRDDVQARVVLMNEGETAERLREAGVPTDVLDESRMNALQILLGLRRLVQTHRPDIIHTHRQKENVLGSLANLTSLRVPSVRTVHGAPEHNPSWSRPHKRFLRWLDDYTGRHLQSKVIAVSPELANKLSSTFPQGRVAIIENGVDIDAVRLAAADSADFRIAQPDHKHIGIVGRLETVKRIDIFLDIAETLHQEAPELPLVFHVFGDGSLRQQLQDDAQKRQLNRFVRFHGQRSDIHACIAGLDAMIICSEHEGLPMASLEAAALGVPVISNRIGGLVALASKVNTLTLVENRAPSTYANELKKILNSAERTGPPNRKPETISAKKNAENTARLYEHLTENQASAERSIQNNT